MMYCRVSPEALQETSEGLFFDVHYSIESQSVSAFLNKKSTGVRRVVIPAQFLPDIDEAIETGCALEIAYRTVARHGKCRAVRVELV